MSINHKALFLVFLSAICVPCRNKEIDGDDKMTVDRPYCFRFTWLGPKYNEESRFKNATCGDIVKNGPCTLPLVVTNNSNVPDTNFMWKEYGNLPTQVACRLVKGEVCAKFSYSFNGAIENITYLCTKVNIENETAVSQGCYKQMKNGHDIELCVCESWAGQTPCNGGNKIHILATLIVCLIVLLYCMVT